MLLTGGVYLLVETYNYLVIPMRKGTYSFIYYLIAYVIPFYQLNYCFVLSFEIYKEHKEY